MLYKVTLLHDILHSNKCLVYVPLVAMEAAVARIQEKVILCQHSMGVSCDNALGTNIYDDFDNIDEEIVVDYMIIIKFKR